MSGRDNQSADDQWRQRLYDVFTDDAPFAHKQRRALEIGQEYLRIENGHVKRIDGEVHTVVESVGDQSVIPVGETLARSETYCRPTVEQGSTLAVADAEAEGYGENPAYTETGLGCYLGTPMFVDGEVYGTVCFTAGEGRSGPFGNGERAFVELIARLLGRELESKRHRKALDERERALERSERKYESLLRTAPDAIVLVEAETGRITDGNEAATDLVGYDRSVLTGMSYVDCVPERQRDRYEAGFDRLTRANSPQSTFPDGQQLFVRTHDGEEIPVEISASTVTLDGTDHVQAIVRDISRRRERQADLRVRNRAMETASVGITIADATDPELPLVYANEAFTTLTGYDTDATLGQNCRFLQGPETDEAIAAEVGEAIRNREPVTRELLNYRADGTPFWNELTITPVENDGSVTHFVGFQRDVTERKRRQRLITVLNRVLRHNLRNKTNVIMGHASELAERLDGEYEALTTQIVQSTQALAELSNTARDLETAVGDRSPTPRDVVTVVERAVEEFDADATVGLEAPESASAVVPAQFPTALTELLDNAVKHGCGAEAVSVTVTDADDGVRVTVTDGGPGLPENERQVLERGYETPLEHSGGLGLMLVTWIVTSVGGCVTADVDDGTAVTVRLPGRCAESNPVTHAPIGTGRQDD